jgi:spermidine synthase
MKQKLLLLVSIATSLSMFLNIDLPIFTLYSWSIYLSLLSLITLTIFVYKIFEIFRNRIHYYFRFLPQRALEKFKKYDQYTYLVFLLSLGLIQPFRPTLSLFLLIIALFTIAQFLLMILITKPLEKEKIFCSNYTVAFIFLFSGFAALIYQIVWQKELLSIYGANSESITIIVAVFMAGLGIGALISDQIAKLFKYNYLRVFLILELLIGIYGFISLNLIDHIALSFNHYSLYDLVLQTLLSILIPTILMGATLPILVAYLNQYISNVGKTVGRLYAFNTFGSALSACLTILLILVLGGKKSAIILASCCNFFTAWLIYILSKYLHKKTLPNKKTTIPYVIKLLPGLFISFVIGYIALAQEIIWFRVLNFADGNSATTFATLLTFYLTGIGLGAIRAEKIAESNKNPIRFIILNLLLASFTFYLAVPLCGYLSFFNKVFIHLILFIAVIYTAYLTGAILPLIAQITKSSSKYFHYIYAVNIIGAVLGSVITGYYMFEYFTISINILIVTYLVLFLAIYISFYYRYTLTILFICILPILIHKELYNNFLEKIQYYSTNSKFEHIVENRHGIITIVKENDDHIIYGDGVYDGRFNIDIKKANNTNGIHRAYAISLLHPAPKKTLVIGLSSGSWVKVLSDYTKVKEMDIVEINEGYKDVIKFYPKQSSIFNNSKNNFYYDDASLWLKSSDKKYDFILMNTSFYWRSNTNNLLSQDFLKLAKNHLNKDGVIYFNTTGCEDIFYTAAHVFKYIIRIDNFIAASDTIFGLTRKEKESNLNDMLNLDTQDPMVKDELDKLLDLKLNDLRDAYLNSTNHYWLITRDNLGNELKTDNHFYSPVQKNRIQKYFE